MALDCLLVALSAILASTYKRSLLMSSLRLKLSHWLLGPVCSMALISPAWAQADASAVEAMEAYLDFVDYQGGNIADAQIPATYNSL